jgi:hypothetical protein
VRRGDVYTLLTDRPDNRRPVDWERNRVDLLLMEGRVFECPWTGKSLRRPIDYDLDHLLPVSVYPINELWNLASADRQFNQHIKRDRLPSHDLLLAAAPRLELAYQHYTSSSLLGDALRQDVAAVYKPSWRLRRGANADNRRTWSGAGRSSGRTRRAKPTCACGRRPPCHKHTGRILRAWARPTRPHDCWPPPLPQTCRAAR